MGAQAALSPGRERGGLLQRARFFPLGPAHSWGCPGPRWSVGSTLLGASALPCMLGSTSSIPGAHVYFAGKEMKPLKVNPASGTHRSNVKGRGPAAMSPWPASALSAPGGLRPVWDSGGRRLRELGLVPRLVPITPFRTIPGLNTMIDKRVS